MTQSLHHAIVPVLGAAKEHRYVVFKVKVEVEDPTPAQSEAAKRRSMDALMSANKPRFQLKRYSGTNSYFTIKSVFNRVVDKFDAMGCGFREKHLVEMYSDSPSKRRSLITASTTRHYTAHRRPPPAARRCPLPAACRPPCAAHCPSTTAHRSPILTTPYPNL